MAQFRLTKKFAIDIKVSKLGSPSLVTPMLDDWFIDVIRVQRKKVAMVTHVKSLLTFLLPYEQVGGAKSIPDCIGVLLNRFLNENELDVDGDQIQKLFSRPPVFCKTDNRRVLGHMNDFKQCINARVFHDNLNLNDIHWDDVMHAINNMLIGTQGYKFATDLAKEIFSGKRKNLI